MKNNTIFVEESINFKEIFRKFQSYWYLFLILSSITIIIALLFNKYSTPIYKASTTVLLKENNKGSTINPTDILEGFGLFAGQKNIENEIGILKSYSIINMTIKEMDLRVSYYHKKNFVMNELYNNSPFIVVFDSTSPQPVDIMFNIMILSDNTFSLKVKEKDARTYNFDTNKKTKKSINKLLIDTIYNFGDEIKSDNYNFKIVLSENHYQNREKDKEMELFFSFNDLNTLTNDYIDLLKLHPIKKDASLIEISIEGNSVEKIITFLNKLTEVYLIRDLNRKNKIALNTINFIDNQLIEITDSLNFAENNLQKFRKLNKIVNIGFQSQKIFEKMQEIEDERAALLVKSRYYNYLKDYIENNKSVNDILAPSSMGADDPLLSSLILKLTELNSEKNNLLFTTNTKNPYLNILESNIKNTKDVLLENIINIIGSSDISLEEINKRMSLLNSEINNLPQTERKLLGIERKFKLNDAMYTYLLQKRSEAQIAKASNSSDNEVIDYARALSEEPIFPKKKLNYIIALLIGLTIPASYIFLLGQLSDKIFEKRDIENLVDAPILGHIIHNSTKSNLVVENHPKSPISESIRAIRTNLQFYATKKENQTILITSSLTGEGKTFVSINLALIFAVSNKKTLLMGFDLRKPRIFYDFELSNTKGISTYLIDKTDLQESIQKSSIKNLDIMMSGPVPPNPAELINSSKTEELMTQLKEIYDYIIIDSSPLGLVTDPLLLTKYSDTNIFVVRQGITQKRVFASIINNYKKNDVKNLSVLINDVKKGDHFYEYGFKYGYYDETNSDNRNTLIKKILSFTKS